MNSNDIDGKVMPDLDKRLDELLYDVRTNFDFDQGGNKVADQGNAHFIEQIKQAFIDAGWFVPADAELVQQVMNMRAQSKQYQFLYPDLIPLQPNYSPDQLKDISNELSKPRMTGQEWLALYNQAFEQMITDTYGPESPPLESPEWLIKKVALDAAKKAACL